MNNGFTFDQVIAARSNALKEHRPND